MDAHSQQSGRYRRRPVGGWTAWQMTLGYISQHHSPDASLTLQARAVAATDQLLWSAALEWGQRRESVVEEESPGAALACLWQTVACYHDVFLTPDDAWRAPVDYGESEWVDPSIIEGVRRVLAMMGKISGQNWRLILVYQPAEMPAQRVQVRLIAGDGVRCAGGFGPTLLQAIRELFRSVVPVFGARMDARGQQ